MDVVADYTADDAVDDTIPDELMKVRRVHIQHTLTQPALL